MRKFCVQHQQLIDKEIALAKKDYSHEYYTYLKAKKFEMEAILEVINDHLDRVNDGYEKITAEQYKDLLKLRDKIYERIISYNADIIDYKIYTKNAFIKFIKSLFKRTSK